MASMLNITPATKVGELLDAYPQLEAVLLAQAPAFKHLKNPVLRRTVAKVATLEKAADIAGISCRNLVLELRRAAGQPLETPDAGGSDDQPAAASAPRPSWLDRGNVRETVDADALLAAGEMPLPQVMRKAAGLEAGEILRILTAFRPVPLIEALHKKRFRTFLRQIEPERFETFVGPAPADPSPKS
ncbi:MAG: DUF1858 domain-containing protein [bacterium]|nr:DUF1858 domain-containing protein [bacterium]